MNMNKYYVYFSYSNTEFSIVHVHNSIESITTTTQIFNDEIQIKTFIIFYPASGKVISFID